LQFVGTKRLPSGKEGEPEPSSSGKGPKIRTSSDVQGGGTFTKKEQGERNAQENVDPTAREGGLTGPEKVPGLRFIQKTWPHNRKPEEKRLSGGTS